MSVPRLAAPEDSAPATWRPRALVRAWFTALSAWRALGRHPLRAALTMLGISIGVAGVIAVVSLGLGADAQIARRLQQMGDNILYVEAGNRVIQGVSTPDDTMMYEDALAVRRECPAVALVSPHVNLRAQVASPGRNWNSHVRGVDPVFQQIRRWPTSSGRFLADHEVSATARVVVLGSVVAEALFTSTTDPIGATIRIAGVPFEVIGVLARKGAGLSGEDQDDVVIVPWTTAQRRLLGIRHIKDMWISARSPAEIPEAKRQITALLRQRHGVLPGQPDDHSIRDYAEIAKELEATNDVLSVVLSGVAAIALLVGGINTMSIMLVTVTERTREIGVRLAVGAHPRHIRRQFLIEAVLLTLIGGAAGVVMGLAASAILSRSSGWPTVVSPGSIGLGLGSAALVGLVFGYYPAFAASARDPLEALRHD